ncbi:hypothetical protein SAY86_000792 [Trapa natans]|uniref:Pentatricopeptide repeat-containing protein n=1 Tax=Trapa natans TaxID=22666 RepID=A0AAN7MCK4_TRANT|nr:hypothetical protein SAY86_000792 [Trapa natans]
MVISCRLQEPESQCTVHLHCILQFVSMAVGILRRILSTRSTPPICHQSIRSFSSASPPPPDTKISSTVSVLTHLRSKSRWSHLRALFPEGFSPAEFYQVVTRIRNNAHLALRFFDFTRRRSLCEHSLESYAGIIHVLSRARLKGQARCLIKEAMLVLPGSEPVRIFEVLVKTYRECGSAPFVFDLLIECCLEVKDIEEAVEISRLLMSRGISPTVGTCNSLIQGVSRSKGVLAGYDIYRELFRLGYAEAEEHVKRVVGARPHVQTFNVLMLCCYRDGAMDMIEVIWNEMQNFGCAANAYSYSMLMFMYCEKGEIEEAERVWKNMRSGGVEADAMAFNTIISGFCKAGDIERAEELFREMELSGVEATGTSFEHLINGYCEIGDVDAALLLYKDMRRKHFAPDAWTVDAVVKGLCKKSRVHYALNIMKEAGDNLHLSPKMTSYEVLLKELCEAGEMEEALKLQAQMVGRGFQPNFQVYSFFIRGYMKQGNKEMEETLRKEMQDAQLEGVDDNTISHCKPPMEINEMETWK